MKIEPQPEVLETSSQKSLEWLAQSPNCGLDESGLTDIVRLLIREVNRLTREVDFLGNRVAQHDNLL